MHQAKLFAFGGLYVGIRGSGDANTNEIIYRALTEAGLSTELESKLYQKERIKVWKVNSGFVKMLYAREKDFKLKFIVYIELDFTLQRFRLMEPSVKKAAKRWRFIGKCLRNVDEMQKISRKEADVLCQKRR